MSASITVLHVQGHDREEVEQALTAIFTAEERPLALRIEGTYAAVLGRLTADELVASYRYLICRPWQNARGSLAWTPVLELGNRTVGLEAELSRRVDGCAVFTTYVYGEVVSGYHLIHNGIEVDRYTSDPEALRDDDDEESGEDRAFEQERGHPERFADLLPAGTSAKEFAQLVLRPGWWEAHDQEQDEGDGESGTQVTANRSSEEAETAEEDVIDEVDRMRCIALALELWGPEEYPFAQDAEDIPNYVAGPATAIAFV